MQPGPGEDVLHLDPRIIADSQILQGGALTKSETKGNKASRHIKREDIQRNDW